MGWFVLQPDDLRSKCEDAGLAEVAVLTENERERLFSKQEYCGGVSGMTS